MKEVVPLKGLSVALGVALAFQRRTLVETSSAQNKRSEVTCKLCLHILKLHQVYLDVVQFSDSPPL